MYDSVKEISGIIKTSEFKEMGIARHKLAKLVDEGFLIRESQGLYSTPGDRPDEFYVIQNRSGKLVFSYGTALYFHGLSDRVPGIIDITLPQGYNAVRLRKAYSNLRVHYVKLELLEYEIEELTTPQGYPVKVYSKERCICELIKHPNVLDRQIYAQAIKQYFNEPYSTRNIIKVAKVFGVETQIRNYMEMLQ